MCVLPVRSVLRWLNVLRVRFVLVSMLAAMGCVLVCVLRGRSLRLVSVAVTIDVLVLMPVRRLKVQRLVYPPINQHIDLRAPDSAPLHPPSHQLGAQAKGRSDRPQLLQPHAGIHRCTKKHIAAYSAVAVQVGNPHRNPMGVRPKIKYRRPGELGQTRAVANQSRQLRILPASPCSPPFTPSIPYNRTLIVHRWG